MWFVNCELCVRIVSCHGQKILIDIFGVHFKQFKSENCTPKHCTTIPTPSIPPSATPTRCDVIVSQPWQAVYLFSQPQKCSREGQQILLLVFWNSGEMEKKSKGVRKREGREREGRCESFAHRKNFCCLLLPEWLKVCLICVLVFPKRTTKRQRGKEGERERKGRRCAGNFWGYKS